MLEVPTKNSNLFLSLFSEERFFVGDFHLRLLEGSRLNVNKYRKSFREKYNISLKTINKYLIKYDIPHRRNLSIVKINPDKNGRFTFGIFEKPETKVLSRCNDSRIDTSKKEEKPIDSGMRKVCINSNNNPVIKSDEQKEKRSTEKFDYISFIDDLEGLTEYLFIYSFIKSRFFSKKKYKDK